MASPTNQPDATAAARQFAIPAVMKALRTHARGGAEQLFYEDAPAPKLHAGDALVRVHATGITPTELVWDESYKNPDGSARIPGIPGHEVSGVVASLAPDVKDLKPGDAVYGLCDFPRDGAAAEYVAVRAANLAPKPKSIDHATTAAVPLSALTAWQVFFHHGDLKQGSRVLIHGGAGGVGTFAIQLACWRGAHVIATASAHNADFLRGLGADEVIDYRKEKFDEKARDIDLVLDTIGGETQERSWKVLRRGGILIALNGPVPAEKLTQFGVRGVFFIVEGNRKDLTEIAGLIDSGKLKPIVAEVVPLADGRKAFERGAEGHTRGKIVLKVSD